MELTLAKLLVVYTCVLCKIEYKVSVSAERRGSRYFAPQRTQKFCFKSVHNVAIIKRILKGECMTELDKLKHLLHHWKEHNDEHAETYRQWAEKASSLGNEELSKVLDKLYHETKKMNGLFEEAEKVIG